MQYKELYDGLKPNFDKCAAETVPSPSIGVRQCKFNKGYGPESAYCKRHAGMIEKGSYYMGVNIDTNKT